MAARAYPEGALLLKYSTAKMVLAVGTTKFHELINDGFLITVPVGERGKRVTVESVERLANEGVPTTRRQKLDAKNIDVEAVPKIPSKNPPLGDSVVPFSGSKRGLPTDLRPPPEPHPPPRPIITRPT